MTNNISKQNEHIKKTPSKFSKSTLAAALGISMLALGASTPNLISSLAYAEPVAIADAKVPGFADVVEAVSPAVVSVRVEARLEKASRRPHRREFRFDRRFMEEQERQSPFFREHGRRGGPRDGFRHRPGPRRFGMSQGSGFFVSDDGYIVTNHHVVDGGTKFSIVMNDGTEMDATLVGSDPRSDLAVLKVEAKKKLVYVGFDDAKPRVGEWVVAVGNPFGLGGTVTAGIISGHNRHIRSNKYDDFIQIDAAVNKGNSGGPTFNLSGKVVGVNTAIFSPSGGNIGIAFAIPAKLAKDIVADLIDDGTVIRGWLGVQIQPVSKDIAKAMGLEGNKGAIIASAQDDSPAKSAGLKPGDVITAVNGKKIKGPRALSREIGNFKPDSTVSITIWRDNKSQDIDVKLGKLADPTKMAAKGPARDKNSPVRIGLELAPTSDGKGVEVVDVVPGSRADKKGIKPGDRILTINGEDITSPEQVIEMIRQVTELKRKAALFQIERDGTSKFVAVPVHQG